MGKRLIVVLALALLVGLTFSAAYAEVQNVKVSGDLTVLGVMRNNFDLHNSSTTPAAPKEDDASRFFSTQTRVRIDADLTDNVMATVRLINERRWNTQGTTSNSNINLDLAYVQLKEFLYSPLTLTIGRQELRFGNQLIIGNSGAYDLTVAAAGNANLNGLPADLTYQHAFDALRATLNYDPLVIDLVYAVLKHGAFATDTTNANDITLMGFNAKYDITKMVSVEAYYWNKKSKDGVVNIDENKTLPGKKDTVNTIGTLLSITPIPDLKTSLEAAYQFGSNNSKDDPGVSPIRKAFALQAMADYTFSKCNMKPSIGASYTYLSGGKEDHRSSWDPMFYNERLNNIVYAILPFTNMQAINIKGSVKPMEDVTLLGNFGYYRTVASTDQAENLDSPAFGGDAFNVTNKKALGAALDLTVLYDYTEDVQFGLTGGAFWPGQTFTRGVTSGSDAGSGRRMANQLIASMKVIF